MSSSSSPYASWAKILGGVIAIAGLASFFYQHHRKGFFDFNELAIGLSWGLVFIFFSKERTDDEMVHQLKFKALAKALIIAFTFTHLYNYIFLNWRLKRDSGMILSISAYQFFALALAIATIIFYVHRFQVQSNSEDEE